MNCAYTSCKMLRNTRLTGLLMYNVMCLQYSLANPTIEISYTVASE